MLLLDPDARPIIGHRGASGEHPENTVLAFDRAIAEGADALELDLHVTADGVPVVIHDSTVDRTTDGTGAVGSHTLDALRGLDAGRGERVPTLAEVLERYREIPLVLEVKEQVAARAVADAIARHGAARRVVVGAFEQRALRPFASSVFLRAASRRETAAFWIISRFRWSLRGSTYQMFTVPEHHRMLTVVDAAFVHAARQLGKPVHVWTVNDLEHGARLRALGVAGIITDFPARMRALANNS